MIGGLIRSNEPPTPIGPCKRVVLHYEDGMDQIIATCTSQPPHLIEVGDLPFGLVKVTPRSVVYKEVVVPDSSIMGRLGDFHPQQR